MQRYNRVAQGSAEIAAPRIVTATNTVRWAARHGKVVKPGANVGGNPLTVDRADLDI